MTTITIDRRFAEQMHELLGNLQGSGAADVAAEVECLRSALEQPGHQSQDFESWLKSYSTLPTDRDAHGYADMTVEMLWHAWQAALKQPEQPAAEPQGWREFIANLAQPRSEPLNSAVAYRDTASRLVFAAQIRDRARELLAGASAAPQTVEHASLTDERIVEVWNSMPGGPDGWLRQFGFLQFARAVEAAVRDAA